MDRMSQKFRIPNPSAGYYLRRLREKKGITFMEMTDMLDWPFELSWVSESDARIMTTDDIEDVVGVFDVDPSFIYGGLTQEQALGFDYLVDFYNATAGESVEEKLDNFYNELEYNIDSYYLKYIWKSLPFQEQEFVLTKFKEWHKEHSRLYTDKDGKANTGEPKTDKVFSQHGRQVVSYGLATAGFECEEFVVQLVDDPELHIVSKDYGIIVPSYEYAEQLLGDFINRHPDFSRSDFYIVGIPIARKNQGAMRC